ncbi:MAG: class I SAM-dependent methyltransferase [Caldilineaceae bacterium]
MTDTPLVWHYGLMAERWAEFINEAREIPYFLSKIEQYGQPVLDLACGVGRVLLPLLGAGIDIDGCDFSEDMLKFCLQKANQAGFNPNLYQSSMHLLDLPRQYKLIYICDSFGLSGSRKNDLETLKRCHAHLAEGGALVVNTQAEYADPDGWSLWLSEKRKSLPEPWPEKGQGRIASDGSEHFGQFRLVAFDPLEQSYIREVRLEKWVAGKLAKAEEYTLRGNVYFKNELLLMLQVAGFHNITVCGDYTEEMATADHNDLIFTAIK